MHYLTDLDKGITLFINGSHSLLWDGAMWTATQTFTWIPIGILLLWGCHTRGKWRLVLLALAMILLGVLISDQLSSSLVKPLVKRYRPTNDPSFMYVVDVVNNYRGGRYGFFSAHASNTFTVAVFLSLLFRYRPMTILLYSWAVLNCYTRIYLGVHYFGDILVGTTVGLCVGYGVYRLSLKLMPELTPAPTDAPTVTPSRFSTLVMNTLSVCLLLTYCSLFILPALIGLPPMD